MFKFRQIGDTDEGFSAKVYHKKDMIYKRRAHSLIYFNDYIYAISGVDKLEMIKKCEKYNIFNDEWIEIPELNYNRQNAALAKDIYMLSLVMMDSEMLIRLKNLTF